MVDQVIFAQDEDELQQRAAQLALHSDSVVRFCISLPVDFAMQVRRGLDGDHDSEMIVRAWTQFRRSIASMPRGSRLQCPVCPRSLKPRTCAFGLAMPYGIEEPENAMMFGLCERCAPDRVTAEANAHRAMERVYPGMRTLGVPAQGGRA